MYIEQTDSTSTLLRRIISGEQSAETLPYTGCLSEDIPTLYAGYQTAGRGQSGNGWESERGQNLLFSFALREPPVAIEQQFVLTMLVALAMHRTLLPYLPAADRDALSIKWPNDIYYKDKKIAGILVENTLQGARIAYSIVGIGLNVNQSAWRSDAPNPLSLRQITGKQYDPKELLDRYMLALRQLLPQPRDSIKPQYCEQLYRRKGFYPYIERPVDTTPTRIARAAEHTDDGFIAEWVDISPLGELVLRTQAGEIRTYHFKQIRFIIS
ncbi:MAG: biotin--[acetyl-CoA-carboxylase] ligase [Paludibacteraceae bacterium]